MIDAEKIIKLIYGRKYSPMNASELAEHFRIDDSESEQFRTLLREIELKGEIVRIKKEQYANPKKANLLVGKLDANQRGFGFVVPVKEGISDDIYVDAEGLGSAMHGDIVVVRLPSAKKKKRGRRKKRERERNAGRIIDVLHRENETVVGTLKKSRHLNYVAPDNSKLPRDIYVSMKDTKDSEHGDKVIVKIDQWPTRHLNAEGTVIEILGKDGEPAVDIKSIIHQFKLPFKFDKNILAETQDLPLSISPDEISTRLDLRDELIITIDPEDAKDFDDAISLKKDKKGNWLLGVHVADVSYYVKQDSAVDNEARKRGTSVYLPGTVIPMLPEVLSNGICSLKEGEERLTKGVFFTYAPDGRLLRSEIKHSVINVKKRLTYHNATKILMESDEENTNPVTNLLFEASILAKLLYKKRMEEGALELNLPEINIRVGENGKIDTIEKVKRDISHIIIEEFMIAANQAVATFMHQNSLPSINRSHPEPDEDEMLDFAEFIFNCKNKRIDPFDKKRLQAFLDEISDHPESYIINLMLLRSLKKAEYSTTHTSHFALGLKHYAHYTSPIRRYPDLIVHRLLDLFFKGQLKSKQAKASWNEKITGWAKHCSTTEKRAEEAEREIIKLKLLRHLEQHADKVMEGVITGIQEYGLFVQIDEFQLDGLVHIRTLTDDFYKLDQKKLSLIGTRRGRVYNFGDVIKVKITKIDLLKREVDFVIV
ncbi:MAG: ribonuclease R [Planctomycetes bacterium RIFCSPHIGHO2_02_FULL_40_12]|nr:MAG: ribonuclease R [Planctomycetes bacterium RIFCSPHIGHO2_02_FULL_40_12]OHC02119.1 MAG: ribonuclease R [Planctomycetes bacterium RIFCSPLOWO2_12_FULL_40_19]